MWGLFLALFNFASAYLNLEFSANPANHVIGMINLFLGVVVLMMWLSNRR